MRAAAIFGLGSSTRDLKPFQKNPSAEWVIGLPSGSSDVDAILIFGGDGTVHRHLADLVKLRLPVLVVPCGSGNDFARALKLRSVRDSVAAWGKFSSGGGNVRTIDLGVITEQANPQGLKPHSEGSSSGTAEAVPSRENPRSASPRFVGDGSFDFAQDRSAPHGSSHHYFCCVGGVGLDGDVARRANRLPRWLRGHGGYVLSLVPALARFAAFPLTISTFDPTKNWTSRGSNPSVLAAFANAQVYGGGMKIAPQAQLDDGQLDVCLVTDIDKFKLFCLFPTVYFGRHLGMPEVEYFHADRLRLETERPLDVYADGEYVCQTPIEVSVAPSALRVIV
jgi:diacylglycerol kinase (ATP)